MNSSLEIYRSEGETQIDVRFENETVWLSLNQISSMFARDKSVVSRHLKNIYSSGELDQNSTVAKNATVQIEGGRQVKKPSWLSKNSALSLEVSHFLGMKKMTLSKVRFLQSIKLLTGRNFIQVLRKRLHIYFISW